MSPSPNRRRKFPIYRQMDAMDCGPACLQMISRYYGKHFSLERLRERSALGRQGVSLLGLSYAAEQLGFRTLSTKATFDQLKNDAPLPCIAHWKQEHFVVVYKVTSKKVHVADPAEGRITHDIADFEKAWCSIRQGDRAFGILLFLEPTTSFEEQPDEKPSTGRWARYLMTYVRQYRRFFVQVILGMLVASLLQLIFPFLTQAIVDHGINARDLGFVYLVLIAQLALFFSRTVVEFIRNRILFHVGTRIYVSIISDFLVKLLKLPISFFDSRMVGDIIQRVQDNYRVQHFLTAATLNVVFSAFTFVAFSIVLAIYSHLIFAVFMLGSVLYAVYILLFLKWRKKLDYQRFEEQAKNQSILYEMIQGMQEIKLNNAEQQKRWDWERVQARLFKVNLRSLTLEQSQDGGAVFINELKNITVTFLAAKLVIDGDLTLGMLLAVQYIIGQLNSPLSQLIWFAQASQDAKISLERLSEVHDREDEEAVGEKITILPASRSLRFKGVSFGYGGPLGPKVLTDLDLE
ncbi:MAG: cysteine peptidase family C39 domain-containing protein, partial [Holophagales bacterium]|nr:cysteine peptidase family C39 domain-containing protein [Holophagales bacterium]